MEFFNSAIDILKILVMALGAGLAVCMLLSQANNRSRKDCKLIII